MLRTKLLFCAIALIAVVVELTPLSPKAIQKASAKSERRTRLQIRPALVRPVRHACKSPFIEAFLDQRLSDGYRLSGDIAARIPRVSDDSDFRMLVYALKDTSESDTVRNEIANLLYRSKYPNLATELIAVLDNTHESPRIRAFAMQHLGQQVPSELADPDERARIVGRITVALTDRDLPVRRQALQNLCRLKEPMGIDTAVAWLKASSSSAEETRDIAIRCLSELDKREYLPLIRKYSTDSNVVVRIAALVALAKWTDEGGREAILDALHSPIVRLQRCGAAVLRKLPKVSLKDRITQGISLLESGNFEAFAVNFRSSSALQCGPFRLNEAVAKRQLKNLLLINLDTIPPVFDDSGAGASFVLSSTTTVRFKRIENVWYLEN